MEADALDLLLKANVAFALATLAAAALRGPARKALGARCAYALWLAPPLVAVAALLPARRVTETILVPAMTAAAPLAATPASGEPATAAAMVAWEPALIAAWMIGAAFGLAIMALRQRRFLKSLEPLEPASHRGVEIFRTGRAGVSPALIGALAPRLVVPADFERLYNEEERDWVIAHELTHQRRGDAVVNALAVIATCVFWFNPFVFLAASRMREDQEMACDAAVLAEHDGARLRYARALVKARLAVEGAAAGCAWSARRPNSLIERIELLRRKAPSRRRERAGAALVACLAFAGGAAAWSAQPPAVTRTYLAEPALASSSLEARALTAPAAEPVVIAAATADAPELTGEPTAEPEPSAPPQKGRPSAPAPASYIDSLTAAGLKGLTADQLIAMKIHGVGPETIRAARAMGFDADPDDLVAMAVAGVTPDFVRKARDAGWKDATLDDLIAMRHMNVDPSDAAGFAKLGLDDLDLEDLIGFAALGVSAEDVRALQAAGVASRDPDDYASAAAMGVTPEFVEKARAHGFKDLSLETLTRLKGADVLD